MKLFNTTNKWVRWWARRKIDWKEHYMNPNHPHRNLIAQVLQRIDWFCLLEVGCAAGANLAKIVKSNPGRKMMLMGVDVNPDAIEYAKKQFSNALFRVGPADNIILSDQSVDVILSDMCMIYISPFKINRHMQEFKRIARGYVVFCELHSASWWRRLVVKWKEGYNVYNWPKLLEKNGYYDIQTYKIGKEDWPESDLQQKHCHIIIAKVPRYY